MLVQPSVLFTATQNAQKRAAAEALLRGEKVEVPPPSSTDLGQLAKFLVSVLKLVESVESVVIQGRRS